MSASVFPPLCVCREAVATVEVRTDKGSERVCKRCAAMFEMFGRLLGADFRKRPLLELIRGSVE